MIDKKSLDKERIRICSYDISRKERTTHNPRFHLVYPSLYQSDKFVLLESEALRFYIYENICEELIVHVDYQQSDVPFNLFKRFNRLILYKRYVECEGEEIEDQMIIREYKAILDFNKVSRIDKPGDSGYRYIKFVFSDKGGEEWENRFSSLLFDEDLDMRIMSSIVEEEGEGKVFDIYNKCKVYIDIYLEYYWYKHVEGG